MVNDYGYVGIDFHNDPDLVLPKGEDWDTTLGKKHAISFFSNVVFYFFMTFIMFLVFDITTIVFCRSSTDMTDRHVSDFS